jgi:hypothetical protein
MSQKQVMQAVVVEFGSVGYAKQVSRVVRLMIIVLCSPMFCHQCAAPFFICTLLFNFKNSSDTILRCCVCAGIEKKTGAGGVGVGGPTGSGAASFGEAELEKIRASIQVLVQHTGPLGTCMDYIQEDVSLMTAELHRWEEECRKYVAGFLLLPFLVVNMSRFLLAFFSLNWHTPVLSVFPVFFRPPHDLVCLFV